MHITKLWWCPCWKPAKKPKNTRLLDAGLPIREWSNFATWWWEFCLLGKPSLDTEKMAFVLPTLTWVKQDVSQLSFKVTSRMQKDVEESNFQSTSHRWGLTPQTKRDFWILSPPPSWGNARNDARITRSVDTLRLLGNWACFFPMCWVVGMAVELDIWLCTYVCDTTLTLHQQPQSSIFNVVPVLWDAHEL